MTTGGGGGGAGGIEKVQSMFAADQANVLDSVCEHTKIPGGHL